MRTSQVKSLVECEMEQDGASSKVHEVSIRISRRADLDKGRSPKPDEVKILDLEPWGCVGCQAVKLPKPR